MKSLKDESIARVSLEDGFFIVATASCVDGYKEIYVDLHDPDDNYCQSLAIVSEGYEVDDDGKILPIPGQYSVKVYSDPNVDDFQHDYIFGRNPNIEYPLKGEDDEQI